MRLAREISFEAALILLPWRVPLGFCQFEAEPVLLPLGLRL
jgi:hypothetical protein